MAMYLHRESRRVYLSADWSELPGVSAVFAGHAGGRDSGLNDPKTRAAARAVLERDWIKAPDLSAVGDFSNGLFLERVPRELWVIERKNVRAPTEADLAAHVLAAAKTRRIAELRDETLERIIHNFPAFLAARDAVEAATDPAAVEAVELGD